MVGDEELIQQVRDALTHLYDYAYLQRHSLADSLVSSQAVVTRTRAQELRRILLDAIEGLNPGDNIPFRAIERRGYAILFGLYVEGQDRRVVADSLGISGRQLRRDRTAAFEALASILRDHYLTPQTKTVEIESFSDENEWLPQERNYVNLTEIIQGLLPLLEPMAREQRIELTASVQRDTLPLYTNRILVRQTLISVASRALANLPLTQLTFVVSPSKIVTNIGLRLEFRRETTAPNDPGMLIETVIEQTEPRVIPLEGRLRQEVLSPTEAVIWLTLPHQDETLVLVVDDNEELFALFQRYAADHPYRLIHARSVNEALERVQSKLPDIITLDLMMPNRDGWELLQLLRSDPKTNNIPVAVCSILDDPDLAFTWGAKFYLKKPVGAVEFLRVLAQARPQS